MGTLARFATRLFLLLILSTTLLCTHQVQAQCTFTNGDFETTNLTGWSVYTRVLSGNIANWYNYTGTISPLSTHTISAPPQGTRGAVTDTQNQSVQELYQNFTLPAGQSGTLTFYIGYNNLQTTFFTPNTLDYATTNQQVRVDLMKTTAPNESVAAGDVYRKLFQTQPGDAPFRAPTLMTFDVSGFAGLPTRLRFAESVSINWINLQVDGVCLSTTRGTITRPTATGSNVTPDFGDVTIRFPTVTAAGTTSLTQLDPATAQVSPPLGDTFIGPAYDLSTTATVTTPIRVCMYLPSITDNNTFSHLRMLHKEAGIWVDLPTSQVDLSSRLLCASVTSLSPFTAAVNPLVPTAAPSSISGKINAPDGAPLAGVTVHLDGGTSRKTISDSNGNYHFEGVTTDNFYTITPSRLNYDFNPSNRSFSLVANVSDAVFTANPTGGNGEVIDSADYFVRQHYLDFLGREPDDRGFNFWSDQILSCGSDAGCIERRSTNVSAAYFLSIEFQQTGGLVDSLYRASYNRRPQFAEFTPDTAVVARNVVVGRANWAQTLEANKQAFVDEWAQRSAFRAAYDGLTNDAFVDTLISHASGFNGDRNALVSGLNAGALTRAAALRQIVEDQGFVLAKSNEMFVMMEYFGYLRRDPDEAGYNFWLQKLNQHNGNFEEAEMVKSFIVSGEYRNRFR